ncbi:37512_t:CDS:1, partial [Gigaspora margarita]
MLVTSITPSAKSIVHVSIYSILSFDKIKKKNIAAILLNSNGENGQRYVLEHSLYHIPNLDTILEQSSI